MNRKQFIGTLAAMFVAPFVAKAKEKKRESHIPDKGIVKVSAGEWIPFSAPARSRVDLNHYNQYRINGGEWKAIPDRNPDGTITFV